LAASTAVAAAVCAIVFLWRGGSLARGTWPGLVAGAVSALAPLAMRSTAACCCGVGACCATCLVGCVGGGVVAGALFGWSAMRAPGARWSDLGVAALFAC